MRALDNNQASRQRILARVRAALGGAAPPATQQQAEAALLSPRRGPQLPALQGLGRAALVDRFCQQAEGLASSVSCLPEGTKLTSAVADWLAMQGLSGPLVVTPEVAALDWAGAGLAVAARPAADADAVGVTACLCGVAETGSLLLCSGPQTPGSVSLLPETHIALLSAMQIVPSMEDAFALVRQRHGTHWPRALNFISGPSRTGDIEQTLVLGAHGPCRVHIFITP